MSVTVLVVIVVSIMIVASTMVVFVFFALASLLLDVTRLVLSRPHKIYWPVASVILLAMPAPLPSLGRHSHYWASGAQGAGVESRCHRRDP